MAASSPVPVAAVDRPPGQGALAGIRVVELGSVIAGPFAARLLGDLGAEVIKVEAPGSPDPLRSWGQAEQHGRHVFWTVHARNKRAITLDLRTTRGPELLLALIEQADVLVESFRPGTLESWNLGFDVLSERNPRLILARLSGYGQTGPDARLPGYASVAEAVSGLRQLTGYPDRPPVRMALSIGDSLGGLFTAQGVLAALVARQRTGRGQVVDTALTDACLAVTESMMPDYDLTGVVRARTGARLDGVAPSNAFPAADGVLVLVAANQDSVFRRLCSAMSRPELADDPRFRDHVSRGRNQDVIDGIVAEWVGARTAAQVMTCLRSAGVVCGPINTVAEVVESEQFRARQMVLPHLDLALGRTVLGPGIVPKLSATPGSVHRPAPPEPGCDNVEVYGDLLGLGREELAGLREQGVI